MTLMTIDRQWPVTFLEPHCTDLCDQWVVVFSQNWEHCEARPADSMLELKEMKTRLNQSMPDCDKELQTAEQFNKVR